MGYAISPDYLSTKEGRINQLFNRMVGIARTKGIDDKSGSIPNWGYKKEGIVNGQRCQLNLYQYGVKAGNEDKVESVELLWHEPGAEGDTKFRVRTGWIGLETTEIHDIPKNIDDVLDRLEADTTNKDVFELANKIMKKVEFYFLKGITKKRMLKFNGYSISRKEPDSEIEINGPDLSLTVCPSSYHHMDWEGDSFPEHVLEVLKDLQGKMSIIY